MTEFTLADLAARIAARARAADPQASYTARLIGSGPSGCARKFGEEAIEAVLAAVVEDDDHLCAEAADVLYHLLVVLQSRNVPLAAVMTELERRTATSGLSEKASRSATKSES